MVWVRSLCIWNILFCIINNFFGERDVLVIRKMGSIYHDGGKSVVDARFAELKRVAVVQMQHDGDREAQFSCIVDRSLGEMFQECLVCVLAGAARYLEDNRRFCFDACANNGLQLLEIVEIKRRDRYSRIIPSWLLFSKYVFLYSLLN